MGWGKKVSLTKERAGVRAMGGLPFQVPGTTRSLEKLKYEKPREKIIKR